MHTPDPTPTHDCLAPLPTLAPADFTLPSGACDTHAHVIARDARYPLVSNRSYTSPAATPEAYLAMLDAQGMARGVLVQVSIHGTDNRYMVQTLQANPERLRGVAVVAPDVSDAQLRLLHDAGVRGLRLNVLFGGGVGLEAMQTLARRIAPMGWHLQFLIDINQLDTTTLREFERLPCPGVIDHLGYVRAEAGLDAPGFCTLLRLVNNVGFWVKLSGAYRISNDFDQFADVTPLAQALVAAAPERMLWGSDWPHVGIPLSAQQCVVPLDSRCGDAAAYSSRQSGALIRVLTAACQRSTLSAAQKNPPL